MLMATAKLTISIKRKLNDGSEIFIAPGVELQCAADDLDATQAAVTERVNGWMQSLLEDYPEGVESEASDEEEEEAEEEADEEAEDEDAEDDEAEGDDEEEGISEDDIRAMSMTELKAFIKENEIEVETKGVKIADLREAVIEALSGDEEDEEAEDEEAEDEDADEESEGVTEEDLKAMKLDELQALCEEWDIGEPTVKKGAPLAARKSAYIKHIMAAQTEEE